MRRSFFVLHVVASVVCFALLLPALPKADEPVSSAPQKTAGIDHMSLDVQLAKARLELAELELQRVSKANQRIVGTYSESTVELLRSEAEIARARLAAVSAGGPANFRELHLRELESSLKIAEINWQAAIRRNKSVPSSVDAQRMEGRRLRVEVARLALARARDPAYVATPVEQLQWQLERVRQDLLELRVRLDNLSHRN